MVKEIYSLLVEPESDKAGQPVPWLAKFDFLVIESSGISEPLPLVQAFQLAERCV